MRKDLRVGLGIGGVLLAVMVVAVVVHSHLKRRALDVAAAEKTDKPETDNTPIPPPDQTGVTSTDPTGPPQVSPTPPAPPAPEASKPDDSNDPFKGPTWDSILLNGAIPPTTPTVTPTVGHGSEQRAIGEHFGPAASNGATPGTFPPTPMVAVDTPQRNPTAPGAPAVHSGSRTHVIAQGETLSTIARTVYGSKKYYLLIEKANPNIVAERLRPGTVINLPDLPASEKADKAEHHAARGGSGSVTAVDSDTQYTVKPNDSLYRISMRLYGSPGKVEAIYDLNKELIGPDRGRLKLGMSLKLPTPPTSASR